MGSTPSRKSIHGLAPLESGGVAARAGFTSQDHVAVSFCLEMLTDPSLKEAWCETQDDITLIWMVDGCEEVEFIQVKDIKRDHFWSVAELCKRDKTAKNPTGIGTSILERSLAHDRCREPCRFRMITFRRVNRDLSVLALPLASPGRCSSDQQFSRLCAQVSDYIPDFKSRNGNECSFWLSNVVWQVEYTDDAVKRKNIEALANFFASIGGHLTPSQIDKRIYPRLLQKAKDAAEAHWEVDPDTKKIKQEEFRTWLERILSEDQYPTSVGAGTDMQRKMEDVSLPPDHIETAHELRRRFRREVLTPQYLDVSDRELIIGEVHAELGHLLSKLDTGELSEGIAFYEVCLRKMRELQESLPTKLRPLLFFLDGCMHDITDRCGHRYQRMQ